MKNVKVSPVKVFVRQGFTESGNLEKEVIQGALNVLRSISEREIPLDVPTGFEAQSQDTFKQAFERASGKEFNPQNFRTSRLGHLHNADAMFVIRTSLSESGAFEVAYNIFGGNRVPVFFAVWEQAPIKTTLLRELQEISDVTYVTFKEPAELEAPLRKFFASVQAKMTQTTPAAFPWLSHAAAANC